MVVKSSGEKSISQSNRESKKLVNNEVRSKNEIEYMVRVVVP